MGRLTWFGAVAFDPEVATDLLPTFSGLIVPSRASQRNPAVPEPVGDPVTDADYLERMRLVFCDFHQWLHELHMKGGASLVSDNPAYDRQWINDGFWRSLNRNPFGHSARRISDFYAGLTGDFRNTQRWKKLRVTKHDHNPVHDALGNVEAFKRMLQGERG